MRFKIFRDEVKEKLTNHWDWDYLSREEMEKLLDLSGEAEAASNETTANASAQREGNGNSNR